MNRYDLPSFFQDPAPIFGPKDKITAYPNVFHAVRTLTNFEYKAFPKTIATKKKRVMKIRALAHDLSALLKGEFQPSLSYGRIEVSLNRISVDVDVMTWCQKVACDQCKHLSMKLVPISEILVDLEAVIDHPDSVGSDSTPLTPKDEAEIAILSNMVGLWSFNFKKYLHKSLENLVDSEEDSAADPLALPSTLFAMLSPENQSEILNWYVGTHSRSKTKFTFRTWNSKGGLRTKSKGPPIPNGTFDSPEDAAEAVLELADQLEVEWSSIPHLVRSIKPRYPQEDGLTE